MPSVFETVPRKGWLGEVSGVRKRRLYTEGSSFYDRGWRPPCKDTGRDFGGFKSMMIARWLDATPRAA